MAIWDDILTERDKQVYEKAGYGKRRGLGLKPAVLVIDVTYSFVGDRPEPILQSIERFPNSCGEEGWQGVYQIQKLLKVAREKKVPVIYTLPADPSDMHGWGLGATKTAHSEEEIRREKEYRLTVVREIAPQDQDIVISKQKASAFIGTPLVSYLVGLGVDTLLVTGCTTSGCVRASVVDGFSYNYRVGVVEECVWDRGQASHKINLFDMNAKYADVISLAEAQDYLSELPVHR